MNKQLKKRPWFPFFAAASLSVGTLCAQVDQIIQSIEQEKANPPKATPAHTATLAPPLPKHQNPVPLAAPPSRPSNKSVARIWGPKDRLPGNIKGQLLAGDFLVLGEYIDGGAVIYAVEDDGKAFIREFVVKNLSSGLAPASYYPDGHKPRVQFTRDNPLVFTGKLYPGLYSVQTTR
jgi:hypothetical protein